MANVLSKFSGDNQAQGIALQLAQPCIARIMDGVTPQAGITVTFTITSYPTGATGQALSSASGVTDTNGKIQSFLTLGNISGTYQVTAASTGLTSVVFSAVGGAIVTLAEAKSQMKFDDTTNDSYLAPMIGEVSQVIEAKLEQPVTSRQIEDIVDGSGWEFQFANYGRIISLVNNALTSLQYRDSATASWTNLLDDLNYAYINPAHAWKIELLDGYIFPAGQKNVRLYCNMGFDPIPGDIHTMALEMVQNRWDESRRSGVPRLGIGSESGSGASVSKGKGFIDLMDTRWKHVIDKWKRWA